MKELLKSKEMIQNDDALYMETKNKKTNWIGYATFLTNGEEKIKVYEGNGDGSDDKTITYTDFINNYTYEIKREC